MSKKEVSEEQKNKAIADVKEYMVSAAIGQFGYSLLKAFTTTKFDENDKMADEEMDRICMQSIHTSTWVVGHLRKMREDMEKQFGEDFVEIRAINVMIAQAAYESSMLAHEYGYKGQCYQ